MISDVVYRIAEVEGESDLEREAREKAGSELWKKWKQLQNSIEYSEVGESIEKWKMQQTMIERQLEALNWERGDVWDSYNEEAPYRRMMESKAQGREAAMMAYYDDQYEGTDGFVPEDD